MTRLVVCLFSALTVACGASAVHERSEPTTGSGSADLDAGSPSTETAGGEAAGGETPPSSTEAVVLRTTVPVPVPLPAIARENLSEGLQAVWTRVEEQVANARPAGPSEVTVETMDAWAQGPFLSWIEARRVAMEETHAVLPSVPSDPTYERALALALFAYAYEDFGAQIASAPVPEEIASDARLLDIYSESLNAASVPLGQRAMELYADCQRRLAPLGDDSEWLPWRAYCVQRGREVIEGYGLTADTLDAAPETRDQEGAEEP